MKKMEIFKAAGKAEGSPTTHRGEVSNSKIDRRILAINQYMWHHGLSGRYSSRVLKHESDSFVWELIDNADSKKFIRYVSVDTNTGLDEQNTTVLKTTIDLETNKEEPLMPPVLPGGDDPTAPLLPPLYDQPKTDK